MLAVVGLVSEIFPIQVFVQIHQHDYLIANSHHAIYGRVRFCNGGDFVDYQHFSHLGNVHAVKQITNEKHQYFHFVGAGF